MQKKNIVLIGFMGTGKSTIGRLLAGRLGRPFIDVDQKIELQEQQSIREIFEVQGEAYFRELERQVLAKLSHYTNAVIATGGGAVLNSENVNNIKKNGILICLTADIEVILERTSRRNTRPLLDTANREAKIAELFHSREAFYEVANFTIDTSAISPQEVVVMILEKLRWGGYSIWKYK